MPTAEGATCRQGLAQHAELLHVCAHIPGLVPTDSNSRHEKRVSKDWKSDTGRLAPMLRAVAAEMAEHEDMAIGENDQEAMSSSEMTVALEEMTRVEGSSSQRSSRP